ncbi:MAG: S-layer homology domain-containing protein [Syntrophorhabdales bacterium]
MKKGSIVQMALILALGALGNAYAASYNYTPLNYPGASSTGAQGINNGGTIVGIYYEANGVNHGFSLSGGTYTPLNYPGASSTGAQGINNGGTIVGIYLDAKGVHQGFSLSGGIYTPLDYPGASGTYAYDINDGGTVVGFYADASGVEHGFSLSGTTYTPLNYPGALSTGANGLNDGDTVVGYYDDASVMSHGFSLSGTTYTPLDYPGALRTYAYGINNGDTIVGFYYDANGVHHGFSLSGTAYTPLDYPGASGTVAYGINDGGTVVGTYHDTSGVSRGFMATPSQCIGTWCTFPDFNSVGRYIGGEYVYQMDIFSGVPSYLNSASDGTANGSYYQCTEYVARYLHSMFCTDYSDVKNISDKISQGFMGYDFHPDYNANPLAATVNRKGTTIPLDQVTAPQAGDIVIFPSVPHAAIVKSVSGSQVTLQVTLIEENYICKTDCGGTRHYMIDRTIDSSTPGAYFYRFPAASIDPTCVSGQSGSFGTFSDVPFPSSSVYYNYIEAIYYAGITTGCGNGDYCPSGDVTRDQMAAFIIRAMYGENFTYTQTPYFSDVPATDVFFKYIQKLKDLNITTTSGSYVPGEGVSRGQMAAFLVRALQVKAGQPTESFTYTQTPYFTDVPAGSTYFSYVQKLKDDGITTVTGTYGVDEIVTRDQMAAFLARAFLGMQ